MIDRIAAAIAALPPDKKAATLVAIDGGSASGKTTLGRALHGRLGGNLIHMDDFFLPPQLRTPMRLAQPGGNVHWERLVEQVLQPLHGGGAARFRPFDCGSMDYGPPIEAEAGALTLVEGAYALHPQLRGFYRLSVLLRVTPQRQRQRIVHRNPDMADRFFDTWIPLENRYFEATRPEAVADLIFDID